MRSSENVIEVTDVKKYFKVYYDRGITLKDRILSRGRSCYEKREVLKGISFSVKKGEAVGLIGKNGCGKSTTLKLLSKIIYPNEGSVELQGRVSSLLELGAGFHPDMSGKENIYMNAAVFGLTRKEIDARIDSIIKFSELEEFIDNPVRTYSSGMYMRLAFSVAINVDADILLIDEILAVGDISFQKKCFERLEDIKRNGTTIIIVSHSLDQIEKICDKSIWIENGLIKEEGKPKDVHAHYLYNMEKSRLNRFEEEYYQKVEQPSQTEKSSSLENIDSITVTNGDDTGIEGFHFSKNLLTAQDLTALRRGSQKVHFTGMYITDANNKETVSFETGSDINIYLLYHAAAPELKGTVGLLIYRSDGLYCYGSTSFIENNALMTFQKNGSVKIKLQNIPLMPGKYFFSITLHDENAAEYDAIDHVAMIQTLSEKTDQGIMRISSNWITN